QTRAGLAGRGAGGRSRRVVSTDIAGGFFSGSPGGVPPVTHVSRTFISRAVSPSTLRKRPGAASTPHGGICPASSSVLIDSPHGTASPCVINDIGATPPLT